MITREINYKTAIGDLEGIIKITVLSPAQNMEEHEDWECRFKLELPNQTINQTVFGIDSLQSLLLTLKTVKSLVLNYSETNNLRLSWLGLDDLGLDMIK